MTFKERPDLPTPIVKALIHDSYRESLDDHFSTLPEGVRGRYQHTLSVTTLPRSPRQRLLFIRHDKEMVFDPIDKMWSILGRVGHSILEDYAEPGDEIEKRLGVVHTVILPNGGTISCYLHGQADLYSSDREEILDWKFTKCGALLFPKDDHTSQLNVLAYIWRKNNRPVSKLKNVYVLRDWSKNYVKEGSEYPKEPILIREVDVWTEDQCLDYINRRLIAHFSNEGKEDNQLDDCSPVERWQSEPRYGVYKMDGPLPQKTAKHWSHSMTEAQDKVDQLLDEDWAKIVAKNNELAKPKPESVIELKRAVFIIREVPSQPRRCPICDCAPWCSQRLSELTAQVPEPEPELYLNDL